MRMQFEHKGPERIHDAYYDGKAIRWDSNDEIPMADVLQTMVDLGEITHQMMVESNDYEAKRLGQQLLTFQK